MDSEGKPLNAYVLDEYIYPTKPKTTDNRANHQAYRLLLARNSYKCIFWTTHTAIGTISSLNGCAGAYHARRTTNNATATEVRAMNINNMALEKSIRAAFSKGNEETLKADGLYYGIREELWSYDETWKDIYEDEQQTLQNNITMVESGGQSQRDLIKYWFPTFTDEQIDEKLAEINAEKRKQHE